MMITAACSLLKDKFSKFLNVTHTQIVNANEKILINHTQAEQ